MSVKVSLVNTVGSIETSTGLTKVITKATKTNKITMETIMSPKYLTFQSLKFIIIVLLRLPVKHKLIVTQISFKNKDLALCDAPIRLRFCYENNSLIKVDFVQF